MAEQHEKINGYRTLTDQEIDLMNQVKAAGARLLKLQREIAQLLVDQEVIKQQQALESKDGQVELARFQKAEPHRWAAIGKTEVEQGVMAIVRAIAQPDPL